MACGVILPGPCRAATPCRLCTWQTLLLLLAARALLPTRGLALAANATAAAATAAAATAAALPATAAAAASPPPPPTRPHPNDLAQLAVLRKMVLASGREAGVRGWRDPEGAHDPCGVPDCGLWRTDVDLRAFPETHSAPPCSWEGVACRDYRVISITLACPAPCDKPITGQLPPSLPAMDRLRRLVLDNNDFQGTLPAWYGWTSMEVLSISHNLLTGALPPQWGTWRGVTLIELGSNDLSAELPAAWGDMQRLQVLHLSNNELAGSIPPGWQQIPDLTELDLRGNCAVCGSAAFAEDVKVQAYGTALRSTCSPLNCSGSIVTNIIIAVAVVLGGLFLCVAHQYVRRRWALRRMLRRHRLELQAQFLEGAALELALRQSLMDNPIPLYQASFLAGDTPAGDGGGGDDDGGRGGDGDGSAVVCEGQGVKEGGPVVILMPDGCEVALAQRQSLDGRGSRSRQRPRTDAAHPPECSDNGGSGGGGGADAEGRAGDGPGSAAGSVSQTDEDSPPPGPPSGASGGAPPAPPAAAGAVAAASASAPLAPPLPPDALAAAGRVAPAQQAQLPGEGGDPPNAAGRLLAAGAQQGSGAGSAAPRSLQADPGGVAAPGHWWPSTAHHR